MELLKQVSSSVEHSIKEKAMEEAQEDHLNEEELPEALRDSPDDDPDLKSLYIDMTQEPPLYNWNGDWSGKDIMIVIRSIKREYHLRNRKLRREEQSEQEQGGNEE